MLSTRLARYQHDRQSPMPLQTSSLSERIRAFFLHAAQRHPLHLFGRSKPFQQLVEAVCSSTRFLLERRLEGSDPACGRQFVNAAQTHDRDACNVKMCVYSRTRAPER